MTGAEVPDTTAWIVAGCALTTLALCLWALPHHRRGRRHKEDE